MDLSGVAMVTRDGTVLTELVAGPADMATRTPCTPETRFQLCSVSKQFAAAAVLLLAESGRLALDDTVDRWLPGGSPHWSGVTLHHLLSHTATLDRNVSDYHTEMEQAAFEPNNLVPGIALSPDKMLLARGFSYADAHRARMGVNYKQIPVNAPKVPVHSYSKDGAMRINNVSDPVYAPNSKGGPQADSARYQPDYWHADGDLVRTAYTLRTDDDWGQPGTLVREVLDDAARERLVSNIAGHLLEGVTEPVLQRAFQYWRNVDKSLGDQVEQGVRAGQG